MKPGRIRCGTLVYADDIIMLGSDDQEVKIGTKQLEGNHGLRLKIENYKFERVNRLLGRDQSRLKV